MTGEIRPVTQFPWKLTAQTKGVQKAYENFTQQYGQEEGLRIFLAKADENSTERLQRDRVRMTYKTGAKLK